MNLRFSRKQLGIPYAVFLICFVVAPLLVVLYYAFTAGNFINFFTDLRINIIKICKQIFLILFYILFVQMNHLLMGSCPQCNNLLVKFQRIAQWLFQKFHQAASICKLCFGRIIQI